VDGSWIGYQIVGDGPIDLVYVTGVASNIETMWDWPDFARALERMASYSRLILFDPRGSGVSDGIPSDRVATWELLAQDTLAVLEAAKSERSAILGQYDGGLTAILFAATYPERTSALVLWNGYARSIYDDDYPIGARPDEVNALWDVMDEIWGRDFMVPLVDPSRSNDPDYMRAAARYLRTASSPGRAATTMRYTVGGDARPALPSVRVPTLVLHSNNNYIPIERGRYVADRIADARFVEVPSSDLNFFGLDTSMALDEIEEFLTGSRRAIETDRVLATVLFTDIVGSTETASTLGDRRWKVTLSEHDRIARAQIDRYGGRFVSSTGDGVLATFDGPDRSIRCAHALGRALEPQGIKIRAGLHTGEIELREGDDIGGIAVHIASRVMSEAGPGEVVCSRTVKDLVAGSEFAFADRGMCKLKGVPDQWQLYAVRQA
ncbi:MAG TPA: adenylate/guanylate cyclase domain-containing protein, partial [Actinomycetota bacterium]|nr:adenylate/guanylate cyclase domain-containing protein [Actinomycetota bacterium]